MEASQLVDLWSGTIAQIKAVTDLCFIAANRNIPTIVDVSRAFGNDTAVSIIKNNLNSLCDFADNKLTNVQFEDASLLIATEYYFLNLSEFALFFRNCKTGKYGQLVWGQTLNIQQVMTALRTFMQERNKAIDQNEKERIEVQKEKGFIKVDAAAQSMIAGIESIRELNKKAKTDFKAFCELFPYLPNEHSPEIWWNAWRGEGGALKVIYGDDPPKADIAERDIGKYLCEYNMHVS